MENKENNEAKNNQKQEFKGKNLEEVISLAEHILKLPRSKFNYEIVAEKTKLFGIKSKEIVIQAWPKTEPETNNITEFLDKILPHFPLDIKYQLKKKNDIIFVIFDGPDKYLLLMKDAVLLMSFQHILNKLSPHKVQVDCDFYRKRKERQLREYSQQVARQVSRTGKDELLDTMNPYERRIVHIAVNQISGISSESIGDGFLKRVKIFPLKHHQK
ncbi:MAG: Jag N-terminal domain-containing protein [Candidatus Aminicenantes bacterium]|nr:Jag N-terminal domain-containing protein [Candidatus Aminicenantes bacterium]